MRVPVVQKPFNRSGLSTRWVDGTVPAAAGERIAAVGFFLANAAATLTISVPSPIAAWTYSFAVLVGASWWSFYSKDRCTAKSPASGTVVRPSPRTVVEKAAPWRAIFWGSIAWREFAMLILAACGALQWMTGATVYRYATLDAWTRTTALVAAAVLARGVLASDRLRHRFLRAFVWFAAAVSALAVLCYFTSPGRLFWIFPSPYPDTWGPFLSRNDFAAFLELALPVALWLGLRDHPAHPSSSFSLFRAHLPSSGTRLRWNEPPLDPRSKGSRNGTVYLCVAAWLLAAGVASASRAGSSLLAAEAIAILASFAGRTAAFKFASAALLLITVVGAGTLFGRWREPDPWRFRREIDRSALAMVAARPITGFGLGTFARVYPAYASFDPGAVVEHAHNDWLEWCAEGGLPYALAWGVIAVSVIKPAARSVWGLGVLAVFLHAVVDYPFARFGVSAWTMTFIGALGADEMREVPVRAH